MPRPKPYAVLLIPHDPELMKEGPYGARLPKVRRTHHGECNLMGGPDWTSNSAHHTGDLLRALVLADEGVTFWQSCVALERHAPEWFGPGDVEDSVRAILRGLPVSVVFPLAEKLGTFVFLDINGNEIVTKA